MYALISLLIVIVVSIIIVKIGAVALEMTGLSRELATFQAQSAFSGVGFTTSESEHVVSHPVRRKIIRILMFVGSAGITSAMATLVLTFINQSPHE
ncbi:MAG: potassium transporter TrkA, partial [Thermoplasmata archaeon]